MRTTLLLLAALLVGLPSEAHPRGGAREGSPSELIDRRISERWGSEGVRPAATADDYEFLRRLSLDLRGVIPTFDEVRTFAGDTDGSKRERIVDAWLRSEEFVTAWSRRWAEELAIDSVAKAKNRVVHDAFEGWIRDAVRSNMPFDRFARRMLTAKGPIDLDPAAGFLLTGLAKGPDGAKDVAERSSRLFLGMQVRCAECHDHPFDDWTQQDFYGIAAFFWQSRPEMTAKTATDLMGRVVEDPSKGDPTLPGEAAPAKKSEEGKKVKEVVAPKAGFSPRYKSTGEGPKENEARRPAFARLLVADPQFARAAVNRHWGMLVGRGLVHPLDGFTVARKPSHPELLADLAADFARNGFDTRRLMKSILLSKPYQLSSRTDRADGASDRLFARALTSPLSSEQLYESFVRATGLQNQNLSSKVKTDPRNSKEAFLREFAPPTAEADPSPAPLEATISQALFLLNGEIPNGAVTQAIRAHVGKVLDRNADASARLQHLFLSTLSRPPSAQESARLLERLAKKDNRPEAYEDLLWALINSTEFATRH